jgi:hypothetical protein
LGSGLFQAPNSSIIMGSVPPERLGTASAMISTLRQSGMSIGTALAGAAFVAGQMSRLAVLEQQGVSLEVAQSQAVVSGFHYAALIVAVLAGLSIIASLVASTRKPDG